MSISPIRPPVGPVVPSVSAVRHAGAAQSATTPKSGSTPVASPGTPAPEAATVSRSVDPEELHLSPKELRRLLGVDEEGQV